MKDFEKRLRFDLSNKDLKLRETLDQDFLELEMYVINDDKPNRNYSHFTKKAMYNSIDTFYNKPVLGFFNLKKGDFEEHNSDLEWDEETEDLYWSYDAIDAEVPLGLVRESDEVEVVEKNGKTWIKLTCAIWVKYNREQVKKLLKDRKKKVSVEVQVNDAHWEEVEGVGEIMFIDSFTFDGVTILGTHRGSSTEPVMEGIEGAHLSILEVAETELFSKQKMALSFAYQKLEGKSSVETDAIFIDQNSEEKEGEETLPNFTNIAEGYTFEGVQDNCAIFKKDEKTYSFSLKDVDCTQDIEFSEENLVEVVEETEVEVITDEAEPVTEEVVETEETVEEEKAEFTGEEKSEEVVEEKAEEENEVKEETTEFAAEDEKPEEEKEAEDEDNDDEDDKDDEDKDEPEEEKETANFNAEEEVPAVEEEVECDPVETEEVKDDRDEKIAELEAQAETYVARISELEAENKSLKDEIFKANCDKMVEYAEQVMSVRDLTDDEKAEIKDNCTKGVYADVDSLEKDIAYILFKKGVGVVEATKANKNFSVSIIQTTEEGEKDKNVFSRLKNN